MYSSYRLGEIKKGSKLSDCILYTGLGFWYGVAGLDVDLCGEGSFKLCVLLAFTQHSDRNDGVTGL